MVEAPAMLLQAAYLCERHRLPCRPGFAAFPRITLFSLSSFSPALFSAVFSNHDVEEFLVTIWLYLVYWLLR